MQSQAGFMLRASDQIIMDPTVQELIEYVSHSAQSMLDSATDLADFQRRLDETVHRFPELGAVIRLFDEEGRPPCAFGSEYVFILIDRAGVLH